MLAAEIQLFPNETLFFQLAIFLVVLVVLNRFVFQPTLKIIRLRRQKTAQEREALAAFETKCEELVKEYEGKLEQAKHEGFKLKEAIQKEGEAQGQKIVREARRISAEELGRVKKELDMEIAAAAKKLNVEAEHLSRAIAAKVLGRELEN